MDILKFALGLRFDLLKDRVENEDVKYLLGQLSAVLSAEETAGLHLYGGAQKLSELDGDGVYTFVFMNGKMKPLREIYQRLEGDAIIKSLLERRIPYIQNNTIRGFSEMEFLGEIGEDGLLSGGSVDGIFFRGPDEGRKPYAEGSSIVVAPSGLSGLDSAEASFRIAAAFKNAFPGREIVRIPLPGRDDFMKAVEISSCSERHGMKVTSPYGEKVYADYLVLDHRLALIAQPSTANDGSVDHKPTSAGLGELIKRAAHEGLKEIYVLLTVSEEYDGGYGAASALGCRFMKNGEEISPFEPGFEDAELDLSRVDPLLGKARFFVCDLDNEIKDDRTDPLCRALGAFCIEPVQAFFRLTRFEETLSNSSILITGGCSDAVEAAIKAAKEIRVAYLSDCITPSFAESIPYSEIVSNAEELNEAASKLADKLK